MGRQKVLILLRSDELLFDVQNKTYLTGRSRQTGENAEQVANMQVNDDAENLDQIRRSVNKAFYSLRSKLSEYFENDNGLSTNLLSTFTNGTEKFLRAWYKKNSSNKDVLATAEEVASSDKTGLFQKYLRESALPSTLTSAYSDAARYPMFPIDLYVPSNFNNATLAAISQLCHEYIVNTSVGEWFLITNKTDAGDYFKSAELTLASIREFMSKRVRPSRHGYKAVRQHQYETTTGKAANDTSDEASIYAPPRDPVVDENEEEGDAEGTGW